MINGALMETKELGKTKEKIPALGMGTWKIGSNESEGIEALKTGIDIGMRFIDTAEMYGTEEMVGKTIEGMDDMFIATKVSPNHFRYDDVIKSCNRSLEKLKVKQIDLYQLHWPNSSIPITETMKAMEKLVDLGKIRYIGVSNFSTKEMKDAQNALKHEEIVSNQVEYSVLVRYVEKEILKFCQDNKITVIAYSPFGSGKLYGQRSNSMYDLLRNVGSKYQKTPSQVALNWLMSKDRVVAIPKAANIAHMKENIGALGWKLEDADMNKINDFLSDERPMVWSLNPLVKRTSSFWARLMEYKEMGRNMRGKTK